MFRVLEVYEIYILLKIIGFLLVIKISWEKIYEVNRNICKFMIINNLNLFKCLR